MEALVTPDSWQGRRVFLTGHTGFKGAWLALWLASMGAKVSGFSLPARPHSLFRLARVQDCLQHVEGDLRDATAVQVALRDADPEVVFHLGAQPLVRVGYGSPVETWATNVMGTVNLLEACRNQASLRAVVCITSDKCYENREWPWPYRESDQMGGHDPYSSSKGAAEIAISAWRRSFFESQPSKAERPALVASARAGNVIGGGDDGCDRLVPDIMRAFAQSRRPLIRNAYSVRPWQHVLDALSGYLVLAERLIAGDAGAASGWNFGPALADAKPVHWVADRLSLQWGATGWDRPEPATLSSQPHEARLLRLDCAKAQEELGWRPAYGIGQALDMVVDWHRSVLGGSDPRSVTFSQIATHPVSPAGAAGRRPDSAPGEDAPLEREHSA